jgi:CBS domain-containing protein
MHGDTQEQGVVGLIDTLDILAYIVELFGENDSKNHHVNIFDRLENGGKLAREKIVSITDFAHNPYTPIQKGRSVYEACQLLIKYKSHRCPVINEQGKIVSMVTQAAIVNLFAANIDKMGHLAKKTVGELKLGLKPVVTVPKTMRTIDAFKVMHEHKISGVGVVDHSGILIGNLSARDLKHLDASNIYSCMYASASSFIQRVRANMINIVHPAISCTTETDLGFVIGRLSANRIHRLYVCDKDLHPIGVIALRDVIQCVLEQLEKGCTPSCS